VTLLSAAAGLLVVAFVFYLGDVGSGGERVFPIAAGGGLLGGLLAVMLRGWRFVLGLIGAQVAAYALAIRVADAVTPDCDPGEDCFGQGVTFAILWVTLALALAAGGVTGYAVRRFRPTSRND
jgi:hypothetical protein